MASGKITAGQRYSFVPAQYARQTESDRMPGRYCRCDWWMDNTGYWPRIWQWLSLRRQTSLVGEIGFDKGPLTKVEGTKAAMLAHQWVNLGPRTNNGAAKTCLVPSHCAKGNPITCNINTLSGFKQISNTFLWYTRWYTGLKWSFPRAEVQGPRATLDQATNLSTITG